MSLTIWKLQEHHTDQTLATLDDGALTQAQTTLTTWHEYLTTCRMNHAKTTLTANGTAQPLTVSMTEIAQMLDLVDAQIQRRYGCND